MTNAEKAREIAYSCYMPDTGFNRDDLYDAAMEMAQWKDEQFKQIVKDYIDLAYSSGQEAILLEDILKEL